MKKADEVKKTDHQHQLMTPAETLEPEISRLRISENSDQVPEQLPATAGAPLDVLNMPRRTGPSADLDETNIIEERRTRRLNPRYAAQHALTPEENSKIPAFHVAFHSAFLAETNKISENLIHVNDLSPPSFH